MKSATGATTHFSQNTGMPPALPNWAQRLAAHSGALALVQHADELPPSLLTFVDDCLEIVRQVGHVPEGLLIAAGSSLEALTRNTHVREVLVRRRTDVLAAFVAAIDFSAARDLYYALGNLLCDCDVARAFIADHDGIEFLVRALLAESGDSLVAAAVVCEHLTRCKHVRPSVASSRLLGIIADRAYWDPRCPGLGYHLMSTLRQLAHTCPEVLPKGVLAAATRAITNRPESRTRSVAAILLYNASLVKETREIMHECIEPLRALTDEERDRASALGALCNLAKEHEAARRCDVYMRCVAWLGDLEVARPALVALAAFGSQEGIREMLQQPVVVAQVVALGLANSSSARSVDAAFAAAEVLLIALAGASSETLQTALGAGIVSFLASLARGVCLGSELFQRFARRVLSIPGAAETDAVAGLLDLLAEALMMAEGRTAVFLAEVLAGVCENLPGPPPNLVIDAAICKIVQKNSAAALPALRVLENAFRVQLVPSPPPVGDAGADLVARTPEGGRAAVAFSRALVRARAPFLERALSRPCSLEDALAARRFVYCNAPGDFFGFTVSADVPEVWRNQLASMENGWDADMLVKPLKGTKRKRGGEQRHRGFRVHHVVMASCSEFMREAGAEDLVLNAEPRVVEAMVHFAYAGRDARLDDFLLDANRAIKLLELADYVGMAGLMLVCQIALAGTVEVPDDAVALKKRVEHMNVPLVDIVCARG